MSTLYVVRHGQGRFFTDDYDRLSEHGEAQARALAEFWLRHEIAIDAAYCGTLRRQRRTGEVVAETFAAAGGEFPALATAPGLDEYPGDDLIEVLAPRLRETDAGIRERAIELEAAEDERARYRGFHRLLEAVMARWIAADYPADAGAGLPTWRAFSDGVRRTLAGIMGEHPSGRSVALFTSGGPIGISVQTALEAPEQKAAELNWRVRNASVTRFTYNATRVSLDEFNGVAHLLPDLLTYR